MSRKLPEVQFEEYALRLNAGDCASRSKAKAKPQRREPAGSSTRTIPMGERTWTDIEPQGYSLTHLFSAKQTDQSSSSWKSTSKDDGAIEFWRKKIIFRTILCIVIIGLTTSGRASWEVEEETRKDFSIVLILQEKLFISEILNAIQDAISLILLYRTMS